MSRGNEKTPSTGHEAIPGRLLAVNRRHDGCELRVSVIFRPGKPFVRIVTTRENTDGITWRITGNATFGADEIPGLLIALKAAAKELPSPAELAAFRFFNSARPDGQASSEEHHAQL